MLLQVHRLVHLLPEVNRQMLEVLLSHLSKIVQKSDKVGALTSSARPNFYHSLILALKSYFKSKK